MVGLKELISSELGEKSKANVDLERLYSAAGRNVKYRVLARAIAVPTVGIMGEWPAEERNTIEAVLRAAWKSHQPGYVRAAGFFGAHDSEVAPHIKAIQTMEKMEAGDIAKVRIGSQEYFLAAFPYEPFSDLVLFVK